MTWLDFIDSFARRGGQNLILFALTIVFSFMVAHKAIPPELTLTPVITGMMAFMRGGTDPAPILAPPKDPKNGQ